MVGGFFGNIFKEDLSKDNRINMEPVKANLIEGVSAGACELVAIDAKVNH